MKVSKIVDYYNSFAEWERTEQPAGRLEFDLSMFHLNQHLKDNSKILDLGGGPGRYTIELANQGHQVFLAELSPVLLRRAKEKIKELAPSDRILGIEQVNGLDLSRFENESFDAIVCFGPFYHLTSRDDRIRCANDCYRVLNQGGLIFAAFMPWLSGLSHTIWRGANCPGQVSAQSYKRLFESGTFENQRNHGFQEGFFADPKELGAEFESAGFEFVNCLAVQGIASGREEDLYRIKDTDIELYEEIMRSIIETASVPSVIDTGGHGIYTGRKPQQ